MENLQEKHEAQRGLQNRHIQLIAIAGTIGTGLFLGAGKTIQMTGPSVIFAYILIGIAMFFIGGVKKLRWDKDVVKYLEKQEKEQ